MPRAVYSCKLCGLLGSDALPVDSQFELTTLSEVFVPNHSMPVPTRPDMSSLASI